MEVEGSGKGRQLSNLPILMMRPGPGEGFRSAGNAAQFPDALAFTDNGPPGQSG